MKDQVWEDHCMGWALHYWDMHQNFAHIWPAAETRSWFWLLVAAGAPL